MKNIESKNLSRALQAGHLEKVDIVVIERGDRDPIITYVEDGLGIMALEAIFGVRADENWQMYVSPLRSNNNTTADDFRQRNLRVNIVKQ
tara:strand:+ start:343 stop:612 length:270 start_codon:yes stop_codon:yes gene_type:complete